MGCCSMRSESLRFKVFDHTDRIILITDDGPRAKKLSMQVHGRYQEEWVDSELQAQR
jgi:hypothetical protein